MQGNGWFYEWEFRSLEKSAVNLDSSSWEWEKNKTTNELFIQDYIPTDTVQWFEHVASNIDVNSEIQVAVWMQKDSICFFIQ